MNNDNKDRLRVVSFNKNKEEPKEEETLINIIQVHYKNGEVEEIPSEGLDSDLLPYQLFGLIDGEDQENLATFVPFDSVKKLVVYQVGKTDRMCRQ